MKKITIITVLLVLFVSLILPVAASPSLDMLTWVRTSGGMGAGNPVSYDDIYAFAFSPNYATDGTVYAGTYIGVYKSTDQGLTWTNKMASSEPDINSLSVSPADLTGNTLIAGTEDNILQTTDRWDNCSGIGPTGLGVSFAVFSPDYVHDHMIFAGTDGNGIRAKTDSAIWWSIDEGTVQGKVTGIVFDPNYSTNHILYVATNGYGVYKGDGGDHLSSWSWSELNTGLDTANKKFIRAIAISPNFASDHTFFIATDSVGIYKSTNAGGQWNVANDSSTFQTLLFSPDYATDGTVYAGEEGSGVYRTTDRGATWSQMNHGFADPVFAGAVLSLAFAPGEPTDLFAGFVGGSDGGVWQILLPTSQVFVPLIQK
jgi:photosystem II stability/assembly factor-like uncharacterized protein